MRIVLPFFALLALFGFLASLVAHIAGLMGNSRPLGISPWPLHIGIFVVWLPAVLISQKLYKDVPKKDMWKAALRGCPKWMRLGFYIVMAYAFANFIFFVFGNLGTAGSDDAGIIKGFSGHWLIFYYTAFAMLYSAIRVRRSDPAL